MMERNLVPMPGIEKLADLKLEVMRETISHFITDNWGLDEGEKVYKWMCNTFDDDYEEITKIYDYVKSR